jgi:hypothetical protein
MHIFRFTLAFAFLSLLLPASAWIPGVHKTIVSHNGTNLFNSTPGYYRNTTKTKRWIPASGKIRGVNLGSMFVFEPWLAEPAWSSMGCGSYNSEFDCVSGLGQTQANAVFQSHWASWITQIDISQMQSYGLNTIRIPVGYVRTIGSLILRLPISVTFTVLSHHVLDLLPMFSRTTKQFPFALSILLTAHSSSGCMNQSSTQTASTSHKVALDIWSRSVDGRAMRDSTLSSICMERLERKLLKILIPARYVRLSPFIVHELILIVCSNSRVLRRLPIRPWN